jgi:hypothetical protein
LGRRAMLATAQRSRPALGRPALGRPAHPSPAEMDVAVRKLSAQSPQEFVTSRSRSPIVNDAILATSKTLPQVSATK